MIRNRAELFSFLPPAEVERTLRRLQVPYGEFTSEQVTSLEDAFIGLTGKYDEIMLRAIFYKEWLKTRWYYLVAVLLSLGFVVMCC